MKRHDRKGFAAFGGRPDARVSLTPSSRNFIGSRRQMTSFKANQRSRFGSKIPSMRRSLEMVFRFIIMLIHSTNSIHFTCHIVVHAFLINST